MGDAPEAMQTVFDDGSGAPTRVVIARAVALADRGVASLDAAAFAHWIDAEGDRIAASARRLRTTTHGYEEVTLRHPRELIEPTPHEVPPLEDVSTDPDEEARIMPLGAGLGVGTNGELEPLFVGLFHAALDEVLRHDGHWRSEVCLWTPGRIYGPADFEHLLAERSRPG